MQLMIVGLGTLQLLKHQQIRIPTEVDEVPQLAPSDIQISSIRAHPAVKRACVPSSGSKTRHRAGNNCNLTKWPKRRRVNIRRTCIPGGVPVAR